MRGILENVGITEKRVEWLENGLSADMPSPIIVQRSADISPAQDSHPIISIDDHTEPSGVRMVIGVQRVNMSVPIDGGRFLINSLGNESHVGGDIGGSRCPRTDLSYFLHLYK